MAPVQIERLLVIAFVFAFAPVRHRHDHRSYSVVLDRVLPDNECVHDADAHRNVHKRCLTVTKSVLSMPPELWVCTKANFISRINRVDDAL